MRIENIRKITDCAHVNLYASRYRDRLDQEKTWIYASRADRAEPQPKTHASPDAVVIVPFHTGRRKLVLIREFRVVIQGFQIGFPAGLVDPDESIETAGRRELFEETGLTATRMIRQSPAAYSSSGLTDETVSMLFLECEGAPSTRNNEASEDIEVILVSQEEAKMILADPDAPFDVKTWIVLNSYAATGML